MHSPSLATLELHSQSPEATRHIGALLGALVQPGDLLLLHGPLGAGKTHLTQGLAHALGIRAAVRSPTFTLINEYAEGRIPLFHMDLYRVEGLRDLATLGLEEYLEGEGVVVVEWPERGAAALPSEALYLFLDHAGDDTRRLRLEAHGARARALLVALRPHLPPPATDANAARH